MALPDTIRIQQGTPIVWANTTDYSSTVSGLVRTHQIDFTSLASGAARQGAKADLGATRAAVFNIFLGLEFAVAPSSGEVLPCYLAQSPSPTAGNANPGGTSGADALYTGTPNDSLDDSIKLLTRIGDFIVTFDATTFVQYMQLPPIIEPLRYVFPVVHDQSGQALVADAVEMFFAMIPIEGVLID